MPETSPPTPAAPGVAAPAVDLADGEATDAGRLVVTRARVVPPFSGATWGLATHALAASLRRDGRDDGDGWRTDDDEAPVRARLAVAPHPEGARVSLRMERAVLGTEIWALPVLFWPFAFLLAMMVARGELPWAFWVIPALFGLAPSLLLGLRWTSHRAWAAAARRRARLALDAFAAAVDQGNALEVSPVARLFVPAEGAAADAARRALTVEDDAWDAPFVVPEISSADPLELWISLDEAEALGAELRAGRLDLRADALARRLGAGGDGEPSGDGAIAQPPVVPIEVSPRGARPPVRRDVTGRTPQPWRVRRRRDTPPAHGGWVQRTLGSGFGEWLPEREGVARPEPLADPVRPGDPGRRP